MSEFSPPLDAGIAGAVCLLRAHGVDTYESCEGVDWFDRYRAEGRGHAYPDPAVRFHGGAAEGRRALCIALAHGLMVHELRRVWRMEQGEPVGPQWEITFVYGDARLREVDGGGPARLESAASV